MDDASGRYVILDTEYTTWPGALESGWSMPGQHREIVQVAAILVQDSKEIGCLDMLVRPLLNPQLSPLFVELTGIGQEAVDSAGVDFPTCMAAFQEFTEQWSVPVICMQSDGLVFRENYSIHGVASPPTAFHRLVPFLLAEGVDLRGLSSGDLHALTEHPLVGHTHNALHDVRSMNRWLAQKADMPADIGKMPCDFPASDHRMASIPNNPTF